MNPRPQRAAPALRAGVLIAGIAALLGWAAGSPVETWRAMVSAVDASTPSAGFDQLLGSSAALVGVDRRRMVGHRGRARSRKRVAWRGGPRMCGGRRKDHSDAGPPDRASGDRRQRARRSDDRGFGLRSRTIDEHVDIDTGRPAELPDPALTETTPASPMVDRPATPFVASPPPAAKRTPTVRPHSSPVAPIATRLTRAIAVPTATWFAVATPCGTSPRDTSGPTRARSTYRAHGQRGTTPIAPSSARIRA